MSIPIRQAGLSLIEIMVALLLGTLLTLGIVTLFGTTNSSNRIQDGLARLQENGRYAMSRLDADLRMLGGQFCSNRTGQPTGSGALLAWRARTPFVYSATLDWADIGNVASVPASGPLGAAATTPYALSPRWFVQGYECSSGTCSPTLPTQSPFTRNGFPAVGTTDGRRVNRSDALTIRYQSGSGWPITAAATCASDGRMTVTRQDGDDAGSRLDGLSGGNALISNCLNPSIAAVASVTRTGNTADVALATPLGSNFSAVCPAVPSEQDTRIFDFDSDFVTVSYYLGLRQDANANARSNVSGGTRRLIPTLIRRENGVEQELVQGVERLDFLYGVQDGTGVTRYLDAAQVQSALGNSIPCTAAPEGVAAQEPGCLWRSVRSVEIHALLNSVDDFWNLDNESVRFRYSIDDGNLVAPPSPLPSGLLPGRLMRREFVSLVSVRNYNP